MLNPGKYYLYILLCKNNSLYTGITNDIANRMETHKSGLGSKYVRANSPFKLIYQEELSNKIDAAKREWEIKTWSRKKKIETLGLII